MLKTFQTQYKHGQIILNNEVNIPEDATIFVSFKDNTTDDFFLKASESSLDNIWNNSEDDIYEQLLEK
ncbi:MAG: hypothetical protein HW421_3269 [Ignavibacteria bacterium]|nr:hypothetical protein [Ignavibacteria bacterium]